MERTAKPRELIGSASAVLAMFVGTIAAGWLFNAGYYNGRTFGISLRILLHDALGSPSAPAAFNGFALFYLACAVGSAIAVLKGALQTGSARAVTLFGVLALPLVFLLVAYGSRALMEGGWIDYSGMTKDPLSVGDSFYMDGLQFLQTRHGLGVSNLADTGSVVDVLFRRGVSATALALVGASWVACFVVFFRNAAASSSQPGPV